MVSSFGSRSSEEEYERLCQWFSSNLVLSYTCIPFTLSLSCSCSCSLSFYRSFTMQIVCFLYVQVLSHFLSLCLQAPGQHLTASLYIISILSSPSHFTLFSRFLANVFFSLVVLTSFSPFSPSSRQSVHLAPSLPLACSLRPFSPSICPFISSGTQYRFRVFL